MRRRLHRKAYEPPPLRRNCSCRFSSSGTFGSQLPAVSVPYRDRGRRAKPDSDLSPPGAQQTVQGCKALVLAGSVGQVLCGVWYTLLDGVREAVGHEANEYSSAVAEEMETRGVWQCCCRQQFAHELRTLCRSFNRGKIEARFVYGHMHLTRYLDR